MKVAYNKESLSRFLENASAISKKHLWLFPSLLPMLAKLKSTVWRRMVKYSLILLVSTWKMQGFHSGDATTIVPAQETLR